MELQDLPDELLRLILTHVMTEDMPLFLEDEQLHSSHVVIPGEREPSDIHVHYPHCGLTRRVRASSLPGQTAHWIDWLCVNATCRRFSRIGKECFFAQKCLAVTPQVPALLHQRKMAHLSASDQGLALRYVQVLVLLGYKTTSPSDFVAIPRCVSAFQRLRALRLLVGYGDLDTLRRAAAGGTKMPSNLHHALREMGINTPHLALAVAPAPVAGVDLTQLEPYVLPLLRLQAAWRTKRRLGQEAASRCEDLTGSS